MSSLKKLGGQTAIYGLSTIVGRFLNYLLVPLYTRVFLPEEYGVVTEFYAYAGFLLVLFTYGMETAYFRFARAKQKEAVVFTTVIRSVFTSTLIIVGLLLLFSNSLADVMRYSSHPEYIRWFALIIGMDAIAAIPFARLRLEGQAIKYAAIKVINIVVNISLNLLFLLLCPYLLKDQDYAWTHHFISSFYDPAVGVGYIFIANLAASTITLLLMFPTILREHAAFDKVLAKRMLRYGLPLAVAGLAGITNEMLDRILLKYLLPFSHDKTMAHVGIYGACYKLSILMTLFVGAFRLAAEPFFFSHAAQSTSRTIYAKVMKFFVITGCLIFLLILLYLDIFKHFIGEEYYSGLKVVPILLLANLFLGIYFNLSIWYKLSDRTLYGTYISVGGAVLTILLNIILIPEIGYMGAAWTTLICYTGMTIVSWFIGKKYFPVPYATGRILTYIGFSVILYFIAEEVKELISSVALQYIASTSFLCIFIFSTWLMERKSLKNQDAEQLY